MTWLMGVCLNMLQQRNSLKRWASYLETIWRRVVAFNVKRRLSFRFVRQKAKEIINNLMRHKVFTLCLFVFFSLFNLNTRSLLRTTSIFLHSSRFAIWLESFHHLTRVPFFQPLSARSFFVFETVLNCRRQSIKETAAKHPFADGKGQKSRRQFLEGTSVKTREPSARRSQLTQIIELINSNDESS